MFKNRSLQVKLVRTEEADNSPLQAATNRQHKINLYKEVGTEATEKAAEAVVTVAFALTVLTIVREVAIHAAKTKIK